MQGRVFKAPLDRKVHRVVKVSRVSQGPLEELVYKVYRVQ